MEPMVAATQEQSTKITAAEVRERWDRAHRSLSTERQQAALNHSFMRNKQWVFWNKSTGQLEEAPRAPERVRATVNKIGPDSRRVIAKLMRRSLMFDVPPTTADDAAARASRTAEAALVDIHRRQNGERLRNDHAWTTWEGGVGALCVEWDFTAGTQLDESGAKTGDIKVSVLSVHEVGCEPGSRDVETASWWIRGQAFPSRDVQRRFKISKEPLADAGTVDGVYRLGESGSDRADTSLTMVYTLFQRPEGDDPGGIVTIVGDQIVDEKPWYFPFSDRLNIATAIVQPLHGTWLGHTPVTDAVNIQALYNASWSSIIEHLRQAGNARLWVPMGSVDDIEELTDTPGEAVEYNPIGNLRPTYESPPAMPDWWIRQPSMLSETLDDALGQHDVSRGVAPAGVESGIALGILSENDDTPIGAFAKELGECWARVASMVLRLVERYVRETRKATIKVHGGVPEVVEWTGGDLMGQTFAEVPLDAVLPRSRAAQAAYAMQLYDRGVIKDPQSLAKIADLPDQDDLIEGIDPDTARARRENYYLAVGHARLADLIDDHANHLNVHRDFMKSERFEHLPDEVRNLFVEHLAAHENVAAGQAASQVVASQAAGPMAALIPSAATPVLPPDLLAGAQQPNTQAPPPPPQEGAGQPEGMPTA